MLAAQRIRVSGIVQGVGFRPFVWRLAQELDLAGWVRNDSHGVEISVEGSAPRLQALIERLRRDAPPRARIDDLEALPAAPQGLQGFHIAASERAQCATSIGPDTALCEACLQEMFDPANRRWRHAFITCTHCGPRYTIARELPYDRAHTSMSAFALCPDCAREYADPADRRFHAEPIACPQCGPRLTLLDAAGAGISGDPIAAVVRLLREGAIVAVKGLGGYHLACDARNPAAVARLRARKHRETKPLALMAASVSDLLSLVTLSGAARTLLESAERPIVLAPKRAGADAGLAGIAPGLIHFGIALPNTPLQWLLFHEAAGRPAGTAWIAAAGDTLLVMTSANDGGEPLIADDAEALERLAGVADGFLQHDRGIVVRCDDSVAAATTPAYFVRRARGYTPQAIRLPTRGRTVLAVGAHLKNTICVTRGNEAFLSQHIGDLDNAASCRYLEETIAHLLGILEAEPELIAHDLHPDMASSRLATAMATARNLPCIAVQHHHAHIAAVAAEYGWRAPLLGVALDGIGYGTDGGAWGGELLHVEGAAMHRVGHLAHLPLPGGDRAAREPWRMGAAVLYCLGRGQEIGARFGAQAAAAQLGAVLARGTHCPPTSSLGRLFDAAAALLGVATHSGYEGEAALLLEALAAGAMPASAPDLWRLGRDDVLDLLPLMERLADWSGDGREGAGLFHAVTCGALAAWILQAAQRAGVCTVALSGGCMMNALLREGLSARLEAAGVRVLKPLAVPAGDGGISLGQAWVALTTTGV